MKSAAHSLSIAAHAFRFATDDFFLFEHFARKAGHDESFFTHVV
jgi:hypothetical protein